MRYVIFLVDADKLFDTALGMYDFSLVLMIAQHAQKVRNLSSNNLVFTLTRLSRILGNTCRSCVNFVH